MSDSRTTIPLALDLPPDALEQLADLIAERLQPNGNGNRPDPWLDVEAAARYLACEPHRIYDLVAAGRLERAKDGRRLLFRCEWLDQVLDIPNGPEQH